MKLNRRSFIKSLAAAAAAAVTGKVVVAGGPASKPITEDTYVKAQGAIATINEKVVETKWYPGHRLIVDGVTFGEWEADSLDFILKGHDPRDVVLAMSTNTIRAMNRYLRCIGAMVSDRDDNGNLVFWWKGYVVFKDEHVPDGWVDLQKRNRLLEYDAVVRECVMASPMLLRLPSLTDAQHLEIAKTFQDYVDKKLWEV
jgi:hypothetical protein